MGMTRTQKILARHAGRPEVEEGELLVSQVDLTLANDITGPPAIDEFDKIGRPVFNKDKIALVPDHFSPPKDIKSATLCKHMRDFARKHNITNYFEVGRMGIEHALVPDSGLVAPGELVIGADSHICTYGAVNAFSTGVGQTDLGAAISGGMGLAAGANLNPERKYPSMFEPIHGSAPDIAGQGKANPLASIWSASQMLDFFGHKDWGKKLIDIIEEMMVEKKVLTPDMGGTATTEEVGDEAVRLLGK